MIRGMYTALSGMIVEEKKQGVISNNLANSNTIGYKAQRVNNKSFNEVLLKNGDTSTGTGENELGNVSFGVEIDDISTNYKQGAFKATDKATDLALEGSGFFVVTGANGQKFYTRNGNFKKDIAGFLIDNNGNRLTSKNDSGEITDIFVGNKELSINERGEVYLDKILSYQLNLVDFEDYKNLQKVGDNLFKNEDEEIDSKAYIQQGQLEMANVNASDEYADMITAYRSFESNYKVLSMIDKSLDKSVNQLGRVR
ncbi:flagellar hook-basal body complex protein [Oceanirhabdus sp. W0125-5]|uniref:flagellar hook-basal body complex protein n=1 Tax=Oceanirhabdus sp. W0125-5 TaxID=2999116 RepID=UPI0022F2CD51|nr:flagellar hook-basal body complex protein [Oceanirhabdus sp. W0125-5]WBW95408.1 flagellar hook-basal body complex protein [Oceanirhabdus sp. W0125-5]